MEQDWMDIGPRTDQQANVDKANEVARFYYEAFVANPSGAKLLEMWTDRDFYQVVPVNSSVNVYAAVEARRDFIRQIHNQIKLATRGISAETPAN
jgi:hypothetical protein